MKKILPFLIFIFLILNPIPAFSQTSAKVQGDDVVFYENNCQINLRVKGKYVFEGSATSSVGIDVDSESGTDVFTNSITLTSENAFDQVFITSQFQPETNYKVSFYYVAYNLIASPPGEKTYTTPSLSDGCLPDETVGGSSSYTQVEFSNPLGGDGPNAVYNIPDFIKKILDIIVSIGVPLVAIAIIISGFMFLKAQGNPQGLEQAKQALLYAVIGALFIFGAWIFAQSIGDSINEFVAFLEILIV
jgi:hypothetical protein